MELGNIPELGKAVFDKQKENKKSEFVKKLQEISDEYGFDIFPYINYTAIGILPAIGINEIKKDEVKK